MSGFIKPGQQSSAPASGGNAMEEALRNANVMGAAPTERPKQHLLGMLTSGSMMSSNTGSAQLNSMRSIIDKHLANVNKAVMLVTVTNMDHEQGSNTYYSGIIISLQIPAEKRVAAYYYIMLAGSRDLPRGDTFTEGNVRYDSVLTPSELVDAKLIETIKAQVQTIYKDTKLHYAGAETVPAWFDCSSDQAVRGVLSSAINACGTELQVAYNLRPRIRFGQDILVDGTPEISYNLSRIDPNGSALVSTPSGVPVRADLNLVSVIRRPRGGQVSHNGSQQAVTTSKVKGFMDVLYTEPQKQAMYMGAAQSYQCFSPFYAITDVESDIGYNMNTLGLAIDSVLSLTNNGRYKQAFLSSPAAVGKKNRIDTKNVGALNVLANIPTPGQAPTAWGPVMSVNDAGFTEENFVRYLDTIIRPDVFNIAVDCPINGANSWIFSMIDDAARGVVSARDKMLDSWNELTDGQFNKRFDRSAQVFVMSEVILAGVYEDANGQKRDQRDIDLTWMCNVHGNGSQAEIVSWLKTFAAYNRGQSSQAMCLNGRRKMIMAATHDKADFTGIINRHFLSGAVLSALRASLMDVGYNPAIVHQMSTMDFNSIRPTADFVSNGISMGTAMFGAPAVGGYGVNSGQATSYRTY